MHARLWIAQRLTRSESQWCIFLTEAIIYTFWMWFSWRLLNNEKCFTSNKTETVGDNVAYKMQDVTCVRDLSHQFFFFSSFFLEEGGAGGGGG